MWKTYTSTQNSIISFRLLFFFLVSKILHFFMVWLFMRSWLEKHMHDEGAFELRGSWVPNSFCVQVINFDCTAALMEIDSWWFKTPPFLQGEGEGKHDKDSPIIICFRIYSRLPTPSPCCETFLFDSYKSQTL